MLKRIAITLLSAGCLYGVFCVYALFVTPLVQREHQEEQRPVSRATEGTEKRGPKSDIAEQFLPHVPWALHARYQMKNHAADRFIFMQSWEQTPRGEIKCTPFAMVMLDLENPQEPPYTLVSDSAVLEFQNPLVLERNSNPGRIVGCALNGDVEIRGKFGLRLQAPNFYFRERPFEDSDQVALADRSPRAWSKGLIQFEYDGHNGTGEDLDLKLIPKRAQLSRDKPAVDGIQTIRLHKNVEMHLRPESEDPQRSEEMVHINSAGAFEFNLQTNVVTFEDQVRVVRNTDEGNDILDQVDLLTITFRPAEPGESKDDSQQSNQKIAGNLAFSRLMAQGNRVKLISERSDLVAIMQELKYYADEKQIVLQDGKTVRVLNENTEFKSPELTINHDETNQIVSILGRGAGEMISWNPETGLRQYIARWAKQITKHPDRNPKSDQDVIELRGTALLKEERKMIMEAEVIKVWLEPDAAGGTSAPRQPAVGVSGTVRNMKIQRLLAVKDVGFASAEIIGGVDRLEVWFEEGKIPHPETAGVSTLRLIGRVRPTQYQVAARPRSAPSRRPLRRPAARRPRRRRRVPVHHHVAERQGQSFAATPAEVPGAGVSERNDALRLQNERNRQEQPPEKPVEPIDILAKKMQIRIIREGKDNHVSRVDCYGKVDVYQKHLDGDPPLRIQGDQLHIINPDSSNLHQQIFVQGKKATDHAPEIRAHVRDRGMHLEGVDIRTDRKRNFVWMNCPGLLQIPVHNTLDGRKLAVPQLLSVWWKEKMNFDGSVAKFYDNVRIMLEGSTVSCGHMDVTLTERVSMTEKQRTDRDKIEIKEIVCKDGVHLDHRQFEGNRSTGRYRGEVFELTMNQQAGTMRGLGGGWMEFWRREQSEGPQKPHLVSSASNRQLSTNEEDGWNYTKVIFRGDLKGRGSNLEGPDSIVTTTFYDNVEVVYGPVKLPTDVVDPDDLPKRGGTLDSDMLQLKQLPKTKNYPRRYVTMLASGNARITGKSYSGRADHVTYDESLGQMVLRTAEPYYSMLWQEKPVRNQPNDAKFRVIQFYPKTGRYNGFDGKSIDFRP